MWIKIFTNEIFSLRLLIEYLVIFVIWIIAFLNSNIKFKVTTEEITILMITLTCITTYYIATSLLKFSKIKQYISLPASSRSFILSLSVAIYIWLFATKYSLLVSVLIIGNNNLMYMYILLVGFLMTEWSLMLIIEFRNILLALAMILSIVIFSSLELSIDMLYIKGIIYVIVQIGLVIYFRKLKLSHIIRSTDFRQSNRSLARNYFLLVVLNEKVLLINSLMTIITAIVFTLVAPHEIVLLAVPFTIVGLNSGLSTLLSAQPQTVKHTKSLPQNYFTYEYVIFLSCYYLIVNLIIALILNFTWFKQPVLYITLVLILSTVECGQIIYLEQKRPLHNWKVKADLWRNNRKYIVPLTAFTVANLIILISITLA